MDISKIIATELNIKKSQADAAIRLIDEGNTIPFIARYRKEVTGALNDEQLRELGSRLTYLRNLEDRKETVIASIDEQGALSNELRSAIEAATTLVQVEDLYLPYKSKRKTRASVAKDLGLEPFANQILEQTLNSPLLTAAQEYLNPEKDLVSAEAAITGAQDILAEQFANNATYRSAVREMTLRSGSIVSKLKKGAESSVYEMYYDFEESLTKIAGHRVLALNRGENEKVLSVKIAVDRVPIIEYLTRQIIRPSDNKYSIPALAAAIDDCYDRLMAPAIERDIRSSLTEKAEEGAIKVFGKNLQQLLMQPPIAGRNVLGWDPAFRTGCKLAVVDSTGKVLDHTVIFPTAPQNKVEDARRVVLGLIDKYNISLISCGNGTASRESEAIIADIIKDCPHKVSYVITNEAGASVYSASQLATEEFPEYDVGTRSAASIARRVQDPLSELVKIDPKSIGVGQYQHDMNQKKLGESLSAVVEDCVNKVGIDLNTASAPLLEYVSGITKTLARNIVAYRESNGTFHSRAELLKVPKLGPKAFEQAAGFLRIPGSDEPLDNTSVHPESYAVAAQLISSLGFTAADLSNGGIKDITKKAGSKSKLAERLGIGEMTLTDILSELEKPGRDPREEMPKPILRSDVLEMKDLKEGMILKGTVRNVIDFGAFVDIGVHQDGLVHISQMSDRYIKHPLDIVSVGDIIDVMVMSVDQQKGKIALTMKVPQ